MASSSSADAHLEGVAALVFLPDDSHWYGRLVTPDSRQQYTLEGKTTAPPLGHFHQCCFDGETPKFYSITIEDPEKMDLDNSQTLPYVMRIGGDNCSLSSSNVDFHTDELLVDAKAEAYIEKYFSRQLLDKHCYVCIGEMKIDFQGDRVEGTI